MSANDTQVETAVAEQEEEPVTLDKDEATVVNGPAVIDPVPPAAPETKKVPRYIAVGVTPEQFAAIETFANGKALSGVCLQILADTIGFKVEEPTNARKKYASKEEQKAAQEQARKDRQILTNFLLKSNKDKLAELLAQAKAAAAAEEAK